MSGSFISGRFRFNVESRDWERDQERGFRANLDDEFDLRLTRSGKLPDLAGTPVASWILARLARLTDDRLGLAGERGVDGGGYMVEFVVYRISNSPDPKQIRLFGLEESELPVVPDRPIASFQFQADMEGAAVLGRRVLDCPAEEVLEALAAALLAAPTELTPREVAISDPEWEHDPGTYIPLPHEDSRNLYGWDGTKFLGKWNIRDAPLRRELD